MSTKTIYTEVMVDVDLSEFDTEDLMERGSQGVSFDETETLTKIWLHDREGRKDEAYALMREYVLEKLGRVI